MARYQELLRNGELLDVAETAGFDVFVTPWGVYWHSPLVGGRC